MNEGASPDALLAQACARLQTVAVPPEYRAGVARWVEVLAGHIAVVNGVAIDDSAEPANLFRA